MTSNSALSPALTKLLILVYKGHNYSQAIEQKTGLRQSPVSRQLITIARMNYLKSEKEKLKNKTIYSLNWDKIFASFQSHFIASISAKVESMKEQFKSNPKYMDLAFSQKHGIKPSEFKKEMPLIFNKNESKEALRKLIEKSFDSVYESDSWVSLNQLWGSLLRIFVGIGFKVEKSPKSFRIEDEYAASQKLFEINLKPEFECLRLFFKWCILTRDSLELQLERTVKFNELLFDKQEIPEIK